MALSAAQITFFWQREPNASRNDCGAVTQQQVKPSQLPWQPPHAMRVGFVTTQPGRTLCGGNSTTGLPAPTGSWWHPPWHGVLQSSPLPWGGGSGVATLNGMRSQGLYFCVNMHMGVLSYTCTYIHTPMHSVHAQIDICMYITKITEQAELEGMTRIIESNSCLCTGSHRVPEIIVVQMLL